MTFIGNYVCIFFVVLETIFLNGVSIGWGILTAVFKEDELFFHDETWQGLHEPGARTRPKLWWLISVWENIVPECGTGSVSGWHLSIHVLEFLWSPEQVWRHQIKRLYNHVWTNEIVCSTMCFYIQHFLSMECVLLLVLLLTDSGQGYTNR